MAIIKDLMMSVIDDFLKSERGGNSDTVDKEKYLKGDIVHIKSDNEILIEEYLDGEIDEKIYTEIKDGYYVYTFCTVVEYGEYVWFNSMTEAEKAYNKHKVNPKDLLYKKMLIKVHEGVVETLKSEHF